MAYEPFGGFGSKSSSSDLGLFTPGTVRRRKKKKQELTARQVLALIEARQRESHRSLGDRLKGVGKGALGGATWTLDKLMRPSWAVSAATAEALGGESDTKAKNPFGAAWSGFKGETRKGFGEILDEQGVLEDHGRLRGVAGFGLDVVTDPTMWLALAATPVTGGGSIAAYAAAKSAGKGIAIKTLQGAAREAGERALKGETDDILEEILQAAGPKYQYRLGLLKQNKELKSAEGLEELPLFEKAHIAQAEAKAEQRIYDPKRVGFRVGTQKHGFTMRTPMPVLTRPGAKLAEKNVPIISQLSDSMGRAFIPGFRNDILHAGELARKHAAEHNAMVMSQDAKRILEGVDSSLTEDDMLEAIHYFEKPLPTSRGGTWKPMVKDRDVWIPNEKYVKLLEKKGLLSPSQVDFVRKVALTMEHFHSLDKLAGVDVAHFTDRTGRMYFPHITKSGEDLKPTVYQQGFTTKAGFQHGRDSELSLLEVKRLVEQGKLPKDVETNPFEAITRRSRAGAEKQADQSLINTLKAAVGVPARIVDPKKVARGVARLEAAQAKREASVRSLASLEKVYGETIRRHELDLRDVHDKALNQVKKAIAADKKAAKAAKIEELEGKIKRARKPERKEALKAELAKVRKSRISTPRTALMLAEAKKIDNLLEKGLKELNNPRTKGHQRMLAQELGWLKTAKEAGLDAKIELKQAEKYLKDARRGKKNPATKGARAQSLVKEKNVLDEWGNEYYMPADVSNTILKLQKFVAGDDKTVDNFVKSASKWMGAWKILVTTVNPGYRIRNTMTDFWNMWLRGVPAHAFGVYGGRAARVMKAAGDVKDPQHQKAIKIVAEAADHGILSGLFAGDVQRVAHLLRWGKKKRMLGTPGVRLMQDFNRNAENWGRLTHYLYRRESLKESAAEAAMQVKLAHFDYEDLTPFEQKVMKNIAPFYTWTRKNIPYQVRSIFTRPGRYSAFPKLVQESEYAAGGSNQDIPGYAEANFAFKIPFGDDEFYFPQFGVSDLAVFQGGDEAKQRVAGLLGPQFKIPAELLSGKSLFTGLPIQPEGHSRVPFSGRGADLLKLIPGSDIGTTSRTGPGGETAQYPGMSPNLAYLLGQLPMPRAAFGVGATDEDRKRNQAISYLGGQYVQSFDPARQAMFDRLDIEEEVDRIMQDLRDEGRTRRKKRKKSDFDKLLESVLRGEYGSAR